MIGPANELREAAVGLVLLAVEYDERTGWTTLTFGSERAGENVVEWSVKLAAAVGVRLTS